MCQKQIALLNFWHTFIVPYFCLTVIRPSCQFFNHIGWPLTEKITQADCNLTEKERVQFITGDAVVELGRMKVAGDGVMVTYGKGIVATLLNSGLADEIVVVTLPKVANDGEKTLPGVVKRQVPCPMSGSDSNTYYANLQARQSMN